MNGGGARGFRQPRCHGCGLTAALCLCAAWPRLPAPFAISVVMPPQEARAASNSARLATLWLTDSSCHVRGETPPRDALDPRGASLLRDAGGRRDAGLRGPDELLARPCSALLFPGGAELAPPPTEVRHLIVPDGTWPQARRLERRWFASAALPRVELAAHFPTAYGLRRRADPDLRSQLCTFEAIAIAIAQLGDPQLARVLLARFAEWARRARWLKTGGPPPDAAPEPLPHELLDHPASVYL
ncbi:MAG: hypothetical protein RL685_5186 [Pseudomonadota bacterium]|jgi:DTW domain-containing protein YfiP